jgi:hypothetical protein
MREAATWFALRRRTKDLTMYKVAALYDLQKNLGGMLRFLALHDHSKVPILSQWQLREDRPNRNLHEQR